MSEARLTERVRYKFTDDELRDLGVQLAREQQGVDTLRDEKAETTAAVNARIKEAERRVSEMAVKVTNGYDWIDVEIMQMLDEPRAGMKRIMRTDTGEHLRDEPMTAAEKQTSFGFRMGGESDAR